MFIKKKICKHLMYYYDMPAINGLEVNQTSIVQCLLFRSDIKLIKQAYLQPRNAKARVW